MSKASKNSDGGTIEALSRSVMDLDKSRRVGWASSYENAERRDEALRDLNVERAHSGMYRKAASYLLGYVQAIESRMPGGVDSKDRVKYLSAVEFIAEAAEQRAGRVDGERLIDSWRETSSEFTAAQTAKADRLRAARSVQQSEREVMKRLSEQYHAKPSTVRAALKALRSALRHGSGESKDDMGWKIRVTVER